MKEINCRFWQLTSVIFAHRMSSNPWLCYALLVVAGEVTHTLCQWIGLAPAILIRLVLAIVGIKIKTFSARALLEGFVTGALANCLLLLLALRLGVSTFHVQPIPAIAATFILPWLSSYVDYRHRSRVIKSNFQDIPICPPIGRLSGAAKSATQRAVFNQYSAMDLTHVESSVVAADDDEKRKAAKLTINYLYTMSFGSIPGGVVGLVVAAAINGFSLN